MTSFAELRKKKNTSVENLVSKIEKSSGAKKSYDKDERMWYPERDSNGNGFAIIRFLPGHPDNLTPFVKKYAHGFKDKMTGRWFIEDCPTTIGEQCPVCTANSEAWNSGNQDLARSRKRQTSFYANIVVLKDPANPENEGKVFIFRFGKKIFEMISSAAQPEFPEVDEPIDVFNLWEGANFALKIVKKDNQTNYDKSSFQDKSPLYDDDSKMEEVYNQQYDLSELVDPKNFKSEEELTKRFAMVTGTPASPNVGVAEARNASTDDRHSAPAPTPSPSAEKEDDSSEEMDPIAYFESLKG